jgi:hypothetical protein
MSCSPETARRFGGTHRGVCFVMFSRLFDPEYCDVTSEVMLTTWHYNPEYRNLHVTNFFTDKALFLWHKFIVLKKRMESTIVGSLSLCSSCMSKAVIIRCAWVKTPCIVPRPYVLHPPHTHSLKRCRSSTCSGS